MVLPIYCVHVVLHVVLHEYVYDVCDNKIKFISIELIPCEYSFTRVVLVVSSRFENPVYINADIISLCSIFSGRISPTQTSMRLPGFVVYPGRHMMGDNCAMTYRAEYVFFRWKSKIVLQHNLQRNTTKDWCVSYCGIANRIAAITLIQRVVESQTWWASPRVTNTFMHGVATPMPLKLTNVG